MSQKQTRDYFEKKYATELNQYRCEAPDRELVCLEFLIDEGMSEGEFLAHVVSTEESKQFIIKQRIVNKIKDLKN